MRHLVFVLVLCPFAAGAGFQEEIDAAAARGGGTVRIPAGEHEARSLVLRSNVHLVLDEGAVLLASTNVADYAGGPGERVFLSAVDAANVSVSGAGMIDGRGFAFRERKGLKGESQPQDLPVLMRFTRCRNLRIEGITYRRAAAWGCHLRNCDGVTVRRVRCFSHVNNTNDGIDIESANVLIEDCDIDSDDDAVVFKTESDRSFAVTNVTVRNCRLASCCNAVKFGTGSYADFKDIRIEDCELRRAQDNFRFSWHKSIPGVTNRICGIAGLALEVVDGGRMENVSARNLTVNGYQTPIFVRHHRRHAPAPGRETYLRDVVIENLKGCADSRVACSITGVPGLRPRNILLKDVDLTFPGGGTAADAEAAVPEKDGGYPEAHMFDRMPLPAYGLYVRHADDVRLENVRFRLSAPDARPAFRADDCVRTYFNPNTDESKVGPYRLEDPCVFADGTPLRSAADWPRRRAEIVSIFAHEMYGAEPPPPDRLSVEPIGEEKVTAAGFAVRRLFRMRFTADGTGPSVDWGLWLPRHAKGKVPVILALTYRGLHELTPDPDVPVCGGWTRNRPQYGVVGHRATERTRGLMCNPNSNTVLPLQTILARGYAVLCASYTDVSPDPDPYGEDGVEQYPFAVTNGVFTLWGPRDESRKDNITSLGAWAWALSRGLDLAARQGELDMKRTVVTGCSRLGKAALLAASRDERFKVVVPNQCGGGGVCLAKRDFGENVSTEINMFPHWYCRAYDRYAADPAGTLPFDQHLLVASIAPRRVLVEGFGPNDWMDTKAEYLACRAASAAWEFLGLPGLPKGEFPAPYDVSAIGPYLGYVRRTEQHGISGCDWNWMLDFCDHAFERKGTLK